MSTDIGKIQIAVDNTILDGIPPTGLEIEIDALGTIIDGASDQELLDLAVALALMVEDAAMIGQINQTSQIIGRHADELARENIPQRSDGSFIHPYAPDGGPLMPASGKWCF